MGPPTRNRSSLCNRFVQSEAAEGTEYDSSPLPAALDCRGYWCGLRRDPQRRAKAGVCLFRGEVGPRSAAKLLTRNEARIAVNIAKLPELVRRV